MAFFRNNALQIIAIVCAALLAAWVGYSFRESNEIRIHPAADEVTRVIVREPIQTTIFPPGYDATEPADRDRPDAVTITPLAPNAALPTGERIVILRDTVRIAVPAAIAENEDDVRITSPDPVTVTRPIFGTPSVSVATYNPNSRQYETLEYYVKPHPVQYGVELEAYGAAPIAEIGQLASTRLGVAARVYAGFQGVQPFAAVHATTEGVETRAGVRYRLGR